MSSNESDSACDVSAPKIGAYELNYLGGFDRSRSREINTLKAHSNSAKNGEGLPKKILKKRRLT